MTYRIEKDTMGDMQVPADCYYGAQTARSLQNFAIGTETMPLEVVQAFGILKKAAAQVKKSSGARLVILNKVDLAGAERGEQRLRLGVVDDLLHRRRQGDQGRLDAGDRREVRPVLLAHRRDLLPRC